MGILVPSNPTQPSPPRLPSQYHPSRAEPSRAEPSRAGAHLQFPDPVVDAAGVDAGGVEGHLEVDHGAGGLDHRVLLVVVHQFCQAVEPCAAAHVIFAVLRAEKTWSTSATGNVKTTYNGGH